MTGGIGIAAFSGHMVEEAGFFLAFLTIGIVFGNNILMFISIVPFIFLIFSKAYRTQDSIKAGHKERIIKARLNDKVTISTTIEPDGGTGIYTVSDALPDHLGLAGGNNFHVLWNNGRKTPVTITYEVDCTKRGIYTIGPTHAEFFHNSWLEQPGSWTDE